MKENTHNPETPEPVDPEVAAFIEDPAYSGEELTQEVDLSGVDELKQEMRAEDTEKEHPAVPKELPKAEVPTQDPYERSTNIKMWEDAYSWGFKSVEDLGEIGVTEEEKALYIKKFWHDEPIIFSLEYYEGLTVEARALTNREYCVLLNHVIELGKKESFNPVHSATKLQGLCAALQLLTINEREVQWENSKLGYHSEEEILERAEAGWEVIDCWQKPKWITVMNTLRVFQHKLQICDEKGVLKKGFSSAPEQED